MDPTADTLPTRRRHGAVLALLLLTAISATAACSASPPRGGAVDDFSRHLNSADRDAWLEGAAASWAHGLSPADADAVGAAALADPSLNVRLFGLQVLFDRVSDARGAQAAAEQIILGDDLTPLLWSWMHAAPAGTVERRLGLIRKALESRRDALTPEQRSRVDKLLCPPGSRCR